MIYSQSIYKKNWKNSLIDFISKTFIIKNKVPFISIILFIIVIILNSIQYSQNDKYLQNQVENSISNSPDSASYQIFYFMYMI